MGIRPFSSHCKVKKVKICLRSSCAIISTQEIFHCYSWFVGSSDEGIEHGVGEADKGDRFS